MAENVSKNFRRWVAANGAFLNPHLSFFHPLESGDRGVVATQHIEAETLLVSVPLHLCVHMPTAAEWASHQAGKLELDAATVFLSELQEPLSPFLATTLLLMHHLAKGQDSFNAPYLATLPAQHDCTLRWTDAEVAELAGTSIEGCGRSSAKQEFQRAVKPVMQRRRDLWPHKQCTLTAFLHAAGMVQSRAFHMQQDNWITGECTVGKELYLIPAIDMLNHSTAPERRNTALQHRPAPPKTGRRKAPTGPAFCMTAGRGIGAGEQVLHTYGDLSDAALLQTYGFVEGLGERDGNPHNFVALPTACLRQALLAEDPAAFAALPADAVPWKDADAVLCRLTDEDPLPARLLDIAHHLAEHEDGAEVEVLPVLFKTVELALARYRGSHREDKAALACGRCTERQRKAMLVRMGERQILLRTKCALISMAADEEGYSSQDSEEGEEEEEAGEEEEEEEEEQYDFEEEDYELDAVPEGGLARSDDVEEEGQEAGEDGGVDLLSGSVLPKTELGRERQGRRSSAYLGDADPVRKRLKF